MARAQQRYVARETRVNFYLPHKKISLLEQRYRDFDMSLRKASDPEKIKAYRKQQDQIQRKLCVLKNPRMDMEMLSNNYYDALIARDLFSPPIKVKKSVNSVAGIKEQSESRAELGSRGQKRKAGGEFHLPEPKCHRS